MMAIEFTVSGATKADMERNARVRLAEFVADSPTQFDLEIEVNDYGMGRPIWVGRCTARELAAPRPTAPPMPTVRRIL